MKGRQHDFSVCPAHCYRQSITGVLEKVQLIFNGSLDYKVFYLHKTGLTDFLLHPIDSSGTPRVEQKHPPLAANL